MQESFRLSLLLLGKLFWPYFDRKGCQVATVIRGERRSSSSVHGKSKRKGESRAPFGLRHIFGSTTWNAIIHRFCTTTELSSRVFPNSFCIELCISWHLEHQTTSYIVFEIKRKKNRQIGRRFALLSKNVNKLSRIFRLLILNHYPKLCILIFPPKINIKLSMTVILSVFGV